MAASRLLGGDFVGGEMTKGNHFTHSKIRSTCRQWVTFVRQPIIVTMIFDRQLCVNLKLYYYMSDIIPLTSTGLASSRYESGM